jgi:hypothetical protein
MKSILNLVGQRYGRLVVISLGEPYTSPSGQVQPRWICQCDCDPSRKILVRGAGLRSGNTESCGCLRSFVIFAWVLRNQIIHDLMGKRFGKLTVIERRNEHRAWLCRCDCGHEKIVSTNHLLSGSVISCGCLWNQTGLNLTTLYHSEHLSWLGMRSRCFNPKNPAYRHYGGRGITICERWLSFTNFLSDMQQKPTPQHTIERRNNNGPYAPDNCYWATRKVQSLNRRVNHLLTLHNKTQCISEWAEELGINQGVIRNRLKRGWPIERTLSSHKCSRYCKIHHS